MTPPLVGEIDALEAALRGTIGDEAVWLETQLALLRRATLQLRRIAGSSSDSPDAPAAQVEHTLHLVTEALRERLTALDTAAAALRSD